MEIGPNAFPTARSPTHDFAWPRRKEEDGVHEKKRKQSLAEQTVGGGERFQSINLTDQTPACYRPSKNNSSTHSTSNEIRQPPTGNHPRLAIAGLTLGLFTKTGFSCQKNPSPPLGLSMPSRGNGPRQKTSDNLKRNSRTRSKSATTNAPPKHPPKPSSILKYRLKQYRICDSRESVQGNAS